MLSKDSSASRKLKLTGDSGRYHILPTDLPINRDFGAECCHQSPLHERKAFLVIDTIFPCSLPSRLDCGPVQRFPIVGTGAQQELPMRDKASYFLGSVLLAFLSIVTPNVFGQNTIAGAIAGN